MQSILIVDDDIEFCEMLHDYLGQNNIALTARHDGSSGLSEIRAHSYDMMLLDVMLPDMDGYEVLRRLRRFSPLRVLMLSTLGSDDDRIMGLDNGADDYLPKPFNPRELYSRIQAILRRSLCFPPETESIGQDPIAGLKVDRKAHSAYYCGNRLNLTDVEFSLLCVFLESPGTVLEREDLVTRVFHRPFNPLDRSLDMHISRLRRKLAAFEELPNSIKTIRSSGYLFSLEPANRSQA